MAFRDIVGQDKAVNILLKTIHRGRIPSSYLFAGESGIGKKFAAINLAKALNCLSRETPPSPPLGKGGIGGGYSIVKRENESKYSLAKEDNKGEDSLAKGEDGRGIDACDECSSCRKIDSGVHPDFLLISPESGQIRIEEIRAIEEVLSLKAFEGRYKVVIVDDADTMNQFTSNAFLKTLEEPPENSLIILISSNPNRLPDTIRSRCSRINFTPLSQDACKKAIEKVINQQTTVSSKKAGKQKSSSIDDSQFATLVRLSMGRPGNIISGDLIEERGRFIKLLKDMLHAEKDGWTSKEEMEKWFDLMLIMLRDMATVKITHDETILINIDMKEYVNKLSSSMELKVIIENYQRLNTIKGYFNFHLNKSLTWNYTGSLLRKTMGDIYA